MKLEYIDSKREIRKTVELELERVYDEKIRGLETRLNQEMEARRKVVLMGVELDRVWGIVDEM